MKASRAYLAEKLASMMAEHRISLLDFATIAGVKKEQPPKWLAGLQVPSRKAITNIADHFKLSPVERDALFLHAGYVEGFRHTVIANDSLRELDGLMPMLSPEARVNVELMLKRAVHRARLGIDVEHIERIRDILSERA